MGASIGPGPKGEQSVKLIRPLVAFVIRGESGVARVREKSESD